MADPLSLLCVDDDADIRSIVTLALMLDPAVDVRAAASGAEALQLLKTGDWQPDCILLDAMMPELSGRMLMSEIRALPAHAETPIIFLTARVTEGAMQDYHALGAIGVIPKPFDPITLAADIRAIIAQPRD